MRLDHVRAGDIVKCRVRGAEFYALVRDREERGLAVHPIDTKGLPTGALEWFAHVTARQVIGHWRKSRAKTAAQRRAELGEASR